MKARSRDGITHKCERVMPAFCAPGYSLPPPMTTSTWASSPDTRSCCICKPVPCVCHVCALLFAHRMPLWLPGLFLCFTNPSRISQTWKTVWNQCPSVLGKHVAEHSYVPPVPSAMLLIPTPLLFTVSSSACWPPRVCNWPLNPPSPDRVIYPWGFRGGYSERTAVITGLSLSCALGLSTEYIQLDSPPTPPQGFYWFEWHFNLLPNLPALCLLLWLMKAWLLVMRTRNFGALFTLAAPAPQEREHSCSLLSTWPLGSRVTACGPCTQAASPAVLTPAPSTGPTRLFMPP